MKNYVDEKEMLRNGYECREGEEQMATQDFEEAVYVVRSVTLLSHAFWKNLDEIDMSLFKAIWLSDVFFEWDSKQDLYHAAPQDLFRLQLKRGSYPAEQHQTQAHVFITYFLDYDLDLEVATDRLNYIIL